VIVSQCCQQDVNGILGCPVYSVLREDNVLEIPPELYSLFVGSAAKQSRQGGGQIIACPSKDFGIPPVDSLDRALTVSHDRSIPVGSARFGLDIYREQLLRKLSLASFADFNLLPNRIRSRTEFAALVFDCQACGLVCERCRVSNFQPL
jgi:hypothetical protein